VCERWKKSESESIMPRKTKNTFLKNIQRGRQFETWERSQWQGGLNDNAEFEAPTQLNGKKGRVDIRLKMNDDGAVVIVEIKATDWDRIKPNRIRPNALRHAAQIWRYIEAHLAPEDVIPAIVYPRSPKNVGRKAEVEAILDERGIQVIWRDEYKELGG